MADSAAGLEDSRSFKRALLLIIMLLTGYSIGESLVSYFLLAKEPGDTAAKEAWEFFDGLQEPAFYLIAFLTISQGKQAERYGALALAALLAAGGAQMLYGLARQWLGWDPMPNFSLPARLYFSLSAIASSLIVLGLLWRFRKSLNPLVMAAFLASQVEAVTTPLRIAAGWAGRLLFDIRWPWQAGRFIGGVLLLWAAFRVIREMLRDNAGGPPGPAVATAPETPHKQTS